MRVIYVGDERNAAGKETRIVCSTQYVLAEFRGELANTVETCTPTFSNTRPFIIAITPPPPGSAGMVGAAPRCALEAAGSAIRKWRAGGEGVFEFFERRDDAGRVVSRTRRAPGFCVLRLS